MPKDLVDALVAATNAPGTGLAQAALVIARIEYPQLDPEPYLEKLDAMGDAARRAMERRAACPATSRRRRASSALNAYLFDEQGFVGNRERYEDPRNSCLNEVLERRTGIPITLSVVYMEVARRAGLHVDGVNFPGHFLVRCPRAAARQRGLIIDPFHGGRAALRARLPAAAAAARRPRSRLQQVAARAGDACRRSSRACC